MRILLLVTWLLAGSTLAEQPTASTPEAVVPASGSLMLPPGDHRRQIEVEGSARSYLVHMPPRAEPVEPVAVVLVLHGAAMNGPMMATFSGMSEKADAAGFAAVYPNGTGFGPFLAFNAGGLSGRMAEGRPDDVKFIAALLDDLAGVVPVDRRRVYATGLSNGGMMCYRLAAELSDRIAAIAPVGGTLALPDLRPGRPVPLIHFHGTADEIVPVTGPGPGSPAFVTFRSVAETIACWRKLNRCEEEPLFESLPDQADDGATVHRTTYAPGEAGAPVVLVEIVGGGHTWPGRPSPLKFLGVTSQDISANDLIWDFFQRHPMP